MSRVVVGFHAQSGAAAGKPFLITTVTDEVVHDLTQRPRAVTGARANFERAVRASLIRNQGYPQNEGDALLDVLGWNEGYPLLVQDRPRRITLQMTEETWHLLPEMTPVHEQPGVWLDQLGPIARTLGQVDREGIPRHKELSVAILYQVLNDGDEVFRRLAETIRLQMPDCVLPDLYPGDQHGSDPGSWQALLRAIFLEHRSVLFLGHLHRPRGRRSGYGWSLAPGRVLSMRDLAEVLAPARQKGRLVRRKPVTEVVFAGCCSSAWKDPAGTAFPQMFLDSGVRFFIGSWMDVYMPGVQPESELDRLGTLISGFFRRWAEAPDDAVLHLYEAKKECGFHLLTGLFQIYTVGETKEARATTEAPAEATAPARGGLVATLAAGAEVGPYRLAAELWHDNYARTFFAREEGAGTNYLIQIPVDEYQGRRDLPERLERAVHRLRAANLGPGILVPNHPPALVEMEPHGQSLTLLVYERPASETPGDWTRLVERLPAGAEMRGQAAVALGREVAILLAELHAKGIAHGNVDTANVVLVRVGEAERVVLKDAWVQLADLGRFSPRAFVAPEEPTPRENPEAVRIDCFSLGVLLWWLASGALPPQSEGDRPRASTPLELPQRAMEQPSALWQLIAQCLMDAPGLRPTATEAARRLILERGSGGGYTAELEQRLRMLIAAGQRLFTLGLDDLRAFDPVLDALENEGYPVLLAAEERGLTRRSNGALLLPWIDRAHLNEEQARAARAQGASRVRPWSVDETAAFNFAHMVQEGFTSLRDLGTAKRPPLVVVEGSSWWQGGSPSEHLAILRGLKCCQADGRAPVVVVVDVPIGLDREIGRSFHHLVFPPLSPYELYRRIAAFPDSGGVPVPAVEEETALELAFQIFPCSGRELADALMLCAVEHGVIDQRAAQIHDLRREAALSRFAALTYLPLSRLPSADALGLPPEVESELQRWSAAVLASRGGDGLAAVPRRLGIEGPPGYGKSDLALVLARRTQRAVVRLDVARCLGRNLGESERALGLALEAATAPQGTVVVLDDIDRLVPVLGAEGAQGRGTEARMGSLLLAWLDDFARGVHLSSVVLTYRDPGLLPPGLRRRLDLRLALARPADLESGTPASLAYREQVFAAVFRRFALPGPARDASLLTELARRTSPIAGGAVPSPFAWQSSEPTLAKHQALLRDGASITAWVAETLRLHGGAEDPAESSFWIARLLPPQCG